MNVMAAILILAAPQEDDVKKKYERLRVDYEVLNRQLEVQSAQLKDLQDQLAQRTRDLDVTKQELQYSRQEAERLARDLREIEEKHLRLARKNLSDGKLTAVSNEYGLVILNLGRDDGVENGMEFTVHRGNLFVAKVQVERVDRQWSAARVLVKKDDPRILDSVTNQILVLPEKPMSKAQSDQLRDIRKELDDIRAEIRKLTDRLVPSWKEHGIVMEPLSEEMREVLGVEGVLVRRVAEGSLSAKRGLQPNDVVLGVSEAALIEMLQKSAPIRVLRKGRELEK